jgi:signal transduction histidine kinase
MLKLLRFSALTIALSYIAVSLVVLAAFATPLWYAWRETVEDSRGKALEAESVRLIHIVSTQGPDKLASAIDLQVGTQTAEAENLILFTDASMVRLAGNLQVWPRQVPHTRGSYHLSIDVNGTPTRARLQYTMLPGGYRLLVASDITKYRVLEKFFIYGLVTAAGAVLLLGIAGGLMIRRSLLVKVHDINRAALAIMQGNFSHRLPAYSGESELNTLVETQNRMLDQIEHLIDGIQNVSNAIAHDLRTPLAELRSRLEELSVTRPGPDQTFVEIEGAIADVDRVIGIFNALLRLAEIDAGTRRAGFVAVDATGVLSEVIEFYQPMAELQGRTLSFTLPGPLELACDPLLLAQAISNLIDNALKYAQKNGTVKVEARGIQDGTIEISVSDDGPGIPDEEKHKVLERFYRGDMSRGTPGVGLGLSLVVAVARLHGGILKLTDNHPGLTATLILYSSANQAAEPGPARLSAS